MAQLDRFGSPGIVSQIGRIFEAATVNRWLIHSFRLAIRIDPGTTKAMPRLLLISSSRVHPTGFLEHCRDAIAEHFSGCDEVAFVPYALADHDHYESVVQAAFAPIGIPIHSIHHAADPVSRIQSAAGIFTGGGNTFRLLKTLYDLKLMERLRHQVRQANIPYMGSSAGTNLAGPTIRTTNDMPIVEPASFEALNLVPFQINPHYQDADPDSTHKGETRAQRLDEYLEENEAPVVAIREGSWLQVSNSTCQLCGTTGMVLFRRGQQAQEMGPSADLSFLLN